MYAIWYFECNVCVCEYAWKIFMMWMHKNVRILCLLRFYIGNEIYLLLLDFIFYILACSLWCVVFSLDQGNGLSNHDSEILFFSILLSFNSTLILSHHLIYNKGYLFKLKEFLVTSNIININTVKFYWYGW